MFGSHVKMDSPVSFRESLTAYLAMSTFDKLVEKLLRGDNDASFSFSDLCYILRSIGFDETIKGSHHIFSRSGIEEQLNLQTWQGSRHAKPYQLRQVRNLLLKYDLGRER